MTDSERIADLESQLAAKEQENARLRHLLSDARDSLKQVAKEATETREAIEEALAQ